MTTKKNNETVSGPLSEGQRWSAARKREVALRMLRGESVAVLSGMLNIERYHLEEWREKLCPESMSRSKNVRMILNLTRQCLASTS